MIGFRGWGLEHRISMSEPWVIACLSARSHERSWDELGDRSSPKAETTLGPGLAVLGPGPVEAQGLPEPKSYTFP